MFHSLFMNLNQHRHYKGVEDQLLREILLCVYPMHQSSQFRYQNCFYPLHKNLHPHSHNNQICPLAHKVHSNSNYNVTTPIMYGFYVFWQPSRKHKTCYRHHQRIHVAFIDFLKESISLACEIALKSPVNIYIKHSNAFW